MAAKDKLHTTKLPLSIIIRQVVLFLANLYSKPLTFIKFYGRFMA